MDLLFTSLEFVCISLGAGSAFIFDTFFMLSLKKHQIRVYEEKMLQRINLFTVIGSAMALVAYIFTLSFRLEAGSVDALDIAFAKIFLLGIAFVTGVTLRKIHLPTLLRNQRQYFHLSEKFMLHQDSLVSTAVFSTFSWLMLILLTVFENFQEPQIFDFSIFSLAAIYIIGALICSKIAVFIKNQYLS